MNREPFLWQFSLGWTWTGNRGGLWNRVSSTVLTHNYGKSPGQMGD
jgi:hypothetical protein